jgi:hypothetical protein
VTDNPVVAALLGSILALAAVIPLMVRSSHGSGSGVDLDALQAQIDHAKQRLGNSAD